MFFIRNKKLKVVWCAGAWESSATLTTTLISIISLKTKRTVEPVPFELPHNTIKPQEHDAKEEEKDNKRAPTVCVFTIKKRIKLKFLESRKRVFGF